ncbi:MAG: lytic transglycosylase domain-containing protein [Sphingomonadaceae bacterium]
MSSMDRLPAFALALLAAPAMTASAPLLAQDSASWDRARAEMVARAPTGMAQAIARWEHLTKFDNLGFESYAEFVMAYPGFPREELLRRRAERALADEPLLPERIVAFFDQFPPLTNQGRARYALALSTIQRPESFDVAREAWRGGPMSGQSELYIDGVYGIRFTGRDHAERMDALLWNDALEAAGRQLLRLSDEQQPVYRARLRILTGGLEQAGEMGVPAEAMRDAGFVYDLARHYRKTGQTGRAADLLASRPQLDRPARYPASFVKEMLNVAKGASASQAARIADRIDDLFEPGADVSRMSFALRDDYTTLMWLGGTKALWTNGDARAAAPLFYRYGAAAQTPQTRSKGFYWAGRAAEQAGDRAAAENYYGMAGQYPDRFYGQLALGKLGRTPVIPPADETIRPSAAQVAAFRAAPLTRAVEELARGAPWRTGIQFYREIAQQATTPEEHAMVADFARQIGRRDLAVNLADAAGADGHNQFIAQGYPTIRTPPGGDWTMIHAISRQESQFAQNAISHAGARGLMQLMPGTAREEAGKAGIQYLEASLINDADYNVQLGSNHIQRLLARYNGSYPLAIAAYNAGPGRVNQWLRANGDPRTGSIDWVTWIERIGITETRTYVHRVIENAVVYEQLNPDQAPYGKPRTAADFLR